MKAVILLALFAVAAASHVPGHIDYPFVYGQSPLRTAFTKVGRLAAVESSEEPVVVVTKLTQFAPELAAVLVERGINFFPESLEDFHDVLRFSNEEFTVCNSDYLGSVESCIEKPLTKFLVPAHYSTFPTTRIFKDAVELPWMVIPEYAGAVRTPYTDFEVFEKPILSLRHISSEIAPITAFSEEHVPFIKRYLPAEKLIKNIHSVPFTKSLYARDLAVPFPSSYFYKSYPGFWNEDALRVKPTTHKSWYKTAPWTPYNEEYFLKSYPVSDYHYEEPALIKSASIKTLPITYPKVIPSTLVEEPLIKPIIKSLPFVPAKTIAPEEHFLKVAPVPHFYSPYPLVYRH